MKEPIKAGDRCQVVSGLGRDKSPNIGLTVTVEKCLGEHSQHGRIWHCTGARIKQMTDAGGYVTTNEGDFAASWLQKIEPPPAKHKAKRRELAH